MLLLILIHDLRVDEFDITRLGSQLAENTTDVHVIEPRAASQRPPNRLEPGGRDLDVGEVNIAEADALDGIGVREDEVGVVEPELREEVK